MKGKKKKKKEFTKRKECPNCGCLYDGKALRFTNCLRCGKKLIWEKPKDKDYLN